MATDPHNGCPRCNVSYKKKYHLILLCPKCGFIKILDTTSRQKYQMQFRCDAVQYIVAWFSTSTDFTSVIVDKLSHDEVIILPGAEHCRIDYWVPFDITLDTLKVYLTFS